MKAYIAPNCGLLEVQLMDPFGFHVASMRKRWERDGYGIRRIQALCAALNIKVVNIMVSRRKGVQTRLLLWTRKY